MTEHPSESEQLSPETAQDLGEAQGPIDGNAEEEAANKVAELTAENEQLKDQLLRTLADLQNFRRRAQQEKEDLRRYATESLVSDLLPVLDNFERTISAMENGATVESLMQGISMIDRQLRSVLESVHLTRIPALGAHFDPEHHEAIATEDTDQHPPGTVTEELQPGYKMSDKVIRPARVKVAKQK